MRLEFNLVPDRGVILHVNGHPRLLFLIRLGMEGNNAMEGNPVTAPQV